MHIHSSTQTHKHTHTHTLQNQQQMVKVVDIPSKLPPFESERSNQEDWIVFVSVCGWVLHSCTTHQAHTNHTHTNHTHTTIQRYTHGCVDCVKIGTKNTNMTTNKRTQHLHNTNKHTHTTLERIRTNKRTQRNTNKHHSHIARSHYNKQKNTTQHKQTPLTQRSTEPPNCMTNANDLTRISYVVAMQDLCACLFMCHVVHVCVCVFVYVSCVWGLFVFVGVCSCFVKHQHTQ